MREYLCVFPQFFMKHGRKRPAQNLPPPYLACPFGAELVQEHKRCRLCGIFLLLMNAALSGALLLGLGMCCTMVWGGSWFIPGILIGIVGMLIMASAYPVFTRITKIRREKLAPEILKLTDELMK